MVWKKALPVVVAIGWLVFVYVKLRTFAQTDGHYLDFDLYYFGGLAERAGSYTDTIHVMQLAAQHKLAVSPSGVFGAPALIAWVFMPLTFLSLGLAERLWDVVTAIALIVAFRNAFGNRWPLLLIVTLTSFAMLSGIQLGNASTLTLALLVGAYGELAKKRTRSAAVLLGVASAFKVYPLVLFVVFAAMRKWRDAAIGIATAVFLTLACVPVFGVHDFRLAIERLWYSGANNELWPDNASVPGAIVWATHSPLVGKAVMALGLLAVVGWVLFNKRVAKAPAEVFAVASVMMLMAQSITWSFYVPVTVLCVYSILVLRPSLPVVGLTVVFWLLACSYSVTWTNSAVPPSIFKTFGCVGLIVVYLAVCRQRSAVETAALS